MSRQPVKSRTGAVLFAGSAWDPTAADGLFAWQRPGGVALLRRRDGEDEPLPGAHPALGGGRIAWLDGGTTVVVADARSLRPRERHDAPGAGVLAVSGTLVAWRVRDAVGADRIWVADGGGAPRLLMEVAPPQELGRPVLHDGRLLTHVAGPQGSSIVAVDLASGVQQTLRSQPGAQLSNPAAQGSQMLYVRATGRSQQLRFGPVVPGDVSADAVLLEHPSSGRRDREREPGRHRHRHRGVRPKLPPRAQPGIVDTLWTTALTGSSAYFTRIRARQGLARSADILRVAVSD